MAQPPAAIADVPPHTVVLTVGDIQLTAAQFEAIVKTLPEQDRAYANGPGRKKFAEEVVRTLTLAKEARRQKLDVEPEFEIQSKYRSDELLAKIGEAAIRDSVRLDEKTLRAYYEAHKFNYERARASHILVRMRGSPVPLKGGGRERTEEEALTRARMLEGRVRAGEDFAKIAAAESDDPGAALNAGEIGWFGHGQLAHAFEDAVFKAQPGHVLGPVKTEFGYHIIKVEQRQSRSFEEVRPEIEMKLRPDRIRKAIEDLEGHAGASFNESFFGPAK